jgi:hypothetical protein
MFMKLNDLAFDKSHPWHKMTEIQAKQRYESRCVLLNHAKFGDVLGEDQNGTREIAGIAVYFVKNPQSTEEELSVTYGWDGFWRGVYRALCRWYRLRLLCIIFILCKRWRKAAAQVHSLSMEQARLRPAGLCNRLTLIASPRQATPNSDAANASGGGQGGGGASGGAGDSAYGGDGDGDVGGGAIDGPDGGASGSEGGSGFGGVGAAGVAAADSPLAMEQARTAWRERHGERRVVCTPLTLRQCHAPHAAPADTAHASTC